MKLNRLIILLMNHLEAESKLHGFAKANKEVFIFNSFGEEIEPKELDVMTVTGEGQPTRQVLYLTDL